jgi:nucleotide-binding universal stress UspA family protein
MIFADKKPRAVAKIVRFGSNCEFLGGQYWRSWFRARVSKDEMCQKLFSRILHANDGSEHSLRAFELALAVAKQSRSEIHMVSVKDIDYMPEFIEDVRQQQGRAARRMHAVLQRARAMAAKEHQKLHCHLLVGHPVQAIVSLARDLKVELLIIGARGHSALYERLVGSKANRIMQLAPCPVLAVKCARSLSSLQPLVRGLARFSESNRSRLGQSGSVIRFPRPR